MDKNILNAIVDAKKRLGEKVIIAAHHYQMPEIVSISDILGDSYKLAVDCSEVKADFIVFCGVSFMAQGAQLLARKGQKVLLPDLDAGCPLAEMITADQADKAYDIISAISDKPIIPVGYVNSNADIKDFCGRKGGAVCTSSNAGKIISHFLNDGKAVFFLPDHNLGQNTASALKIRADEITIVNRNLSITKTGADENQKMFIWNGNCHVHKKFTAETITNIRKQYPKINVIVHPESDPAVVNASDTAGSTQFIYNQIKEAIPGTQWAIGTEIHFVNRIKAEFKDKLILPLQPSSCYDMIKITPEKVLSSLKSIEDNLNENKQLIHEVIVKETYRKQATSALKRMIEITRG